MQKEMPGGGGAGDARTARKKGRKDNEYDVNFKADWGRSNHRRRGSVTPVPRARPCVPAILALHTRTLNFDFVGIKASNVSQVGSHGRPCFVYVLCGTNGGVL